MCRIDYSRNCWITMISFEHFHGNFYHVYCMTLDRVLRCWSREALFGFSRCRCDVDRSLRETVSSRLGLHRPGRRARLHCQLAAGRSADVAVTTPAITTVHRRRALVPAVQLHAGRRKPRTSIRTLIDHVGDIPVVVTQQ